MKYVRLTVFGSRRTADIVLPDDEPVGTLLPDVLDLLEEPSHGQGSAVLVTNIGERIDLKKSLDEQEVVHGTMLRLVEDDDAPQDPDVADVTDAAGAARERRTDLWSPRETIIATASGAAVTTWYSGTIGIDSGVVTWTGVALLALILTVAGTLCARRETMGPAAVLAAASGGSAWAAGLAATTTAEPVTVLTVLYGASWLIIGAVLGFGARRPSALSGAVLAAATVLLVGAVLTLAEPESLLLPVLVVVVHVVVLGLLPGFAAAASGLTRYDDLVIGGEPAGRGDVRSAVDEAFASLTWTLLAAVIPLVLSISVLTGAGDRWALALGGSASLLVILRSRIFPLALQKALILAPAAGVTAVWFTETAMLAPGAKVAVTAVVSTLLIVAAFLSPSPVTTARGRRALTVLELLSVLTILPFALGALGIFGDLFGVFR